MQVWTRRSLAGLPAMTWLQPGARLRAAAFACDATPPAGQPNIWVEPVSEVLDPLWCKGVVLEQGGQRVVLAALDWCGAGGATYDRFCAALAHGAAASRRNVWLHTVHQHAAPYIVEDAYPILLAARPRALRMSERYLRLVAERLARGAAAAAASLEEVTAIGTGKAEVERVASARRLLADGRIVTRFSSTARNPELAGLPEGDVDRELRCVGLMGSGSPVAWLMFYATHPQTFCCDGRVSADFVGAARAAVEREAGAPVIYFTGCAGDVTVGKYNQGSEEQRRELASRLADGMRRAIRSAGWTGITAMRWQTVPLALEAKPAGPLPEPPATDAEAYRAAITAAFARRRRALAAHALRLGPARIVLLPGEPLLFLQRAVQAEARDEFACAAGYGDISPGYLCRDEDFRLGGYEPGASNVLPGAEAKLLEAVRQLCRREA